jgi:ABC-2 type transport system permease protein
MSTPSGGQSSRHQLDIAAVPDALSSIRLIYWSVRRELWENRAIWIWPLAVAGAVLLGLLLSTLDLRHNLHATLELAPEQQKNTFAEAYNFAAFMVSAAGVIVGVFYCVDALHSERRDRSILFWKSLPVSDLTTVLSKASVPLVILPVLLFAIIMVMQLIMLLAGTAIFQLNGLDAAAIWNQFPLFQRAPALLYCLFAVALWHAPIYGWLLLLSGWARRAVFLWAVLPIFAACVVEYVAFHTSYLHSLLRYRLIGYFEAFGLQPTGSVATDPLTRPDPERFLTSPGLWIGLAVAVLFLAAAVRLRRYRGPI